MLRVVDLRNAKGFTLIEGLIVMVVSILGILAGYVIIASARGTLAGNIKVVEAQQEARNVVERIVREIRESNPDIVWIGPEGSNPEWHYIIFHTPRNPNREFIVNEDGRPDWQRAIAYVFYDQSKTLYRHQLYMAEFPDLDNPFETITVSDNIEDLRFEKISAEGAPFDRPEDMIKITIRTFVEPDKLGAVPSAYADYETMVKLRN